ncbi:hypothetical protein PRUB_a2026 [Pseudoalteromonas rubra]|uniref:Uncharacterized protein n=1 Tax=Pseudoalteromonas rubra TaxID=43658 RepID=A0A8T0CHH9_9GAMM|nr:hypothetical protein PRUB_a2026 [Pseudoalteromonas rubra]
MKNISKADLLKVQGGVNKPGDTNLPPRSQPIEKPPKS